MTTLPKALIFIDLDIVIRHFILSGAFAELEKSYDITYVFNRDPESEVQWVSADIEALKLTRVLWTNVTRTRRGSWYRFYVMTLLNKQRGTPNYKLRQKLTDDINGRLRRIYYTLLSLPVIYPLVKKRFDREQGVDEELNRLISDENPDIVIHPSVLTGYYINDLVPICAAKDIPFLVLMNSWDNPANKAILTGAPNRLAVWGDQTRRHAIEYMGIDPEKIEILGAAQFQLYRDPPLETQDELRTLFKVPDGKPILLYAGASKGAHESRYLRMLDEGIESGALPPCHIIYRPHPWRGGLAEGEESFFDLKCRHISIDPFMEDYYKSVISTGSTTLYLADYQVTNKILNLVDGVISPLSTMLLEAILLGKPVLMFFPDTDLRKSEGRHSAIAMRLAHFADFFGVEGVNTCFDEDDLDKSIQTLLAQAHNPRVKDNLRSHGRQFVDMQPPPYCSRLTALVDDMVDEFSGTKEGATTASTHHTPPPEALKWKVPSQLIDSDAVINRQRFGLQFLEKDINQAARIYNGLSLDEANLFYSHVFTLLGDLKLQGVGVELGAGLGTFSNNVCRHYPAVEKIYAVELVSSVAEHLMPRVLSGLSREKVQPVVGSFDNIELPDESVDFCIEVNSLHHSGNVVTTLKEISRILKPGGVLVALDRAHNDHVTDAQINFMLSVEYDDQWKTRNGYSLAPMTRRQNGENEYRLKEWHHGFEHANLTLERRLEMRTVGWRKLARGLLLSLPFSLRRKFDWLPSRTRFHQGENSWLLRERLGLGGDAVFKAAAKDYTLFVLRKSYVE